VTVIVLELWIIYAMLQVDNVSVEHKHMAESVISVNLVRGTIQTVRGVCAMDIQIHATLAVECVLTAKGLQREIIVIGR